MSVAGLYERIHNADSPDNPPFRNARAVAMSTVVKPIQSQLREERLEQGFRGHRLGSGLQHARGFSQNDGRSERLIHPDVQYAFPFPIRMVLFLSLNEHVY